MDGVWARVKLACTAFFTILFTGRLPADLQRGATAPTPAPKVPVVADTADRAVQILGLLQRDGRLVDFLMEDVAAYSDAEIGSAVRAVHAGCRRVLDRYLTLEAILDGGEGEATTISQVNPAAVRLVGNVTGQPPFRGTLLHRGWRTTRVDLPPLGADSTRNVVAQAEVEVA
jgi:hypothetical protein